MKRGGCRKDVRNGQQEDYLFSFVMKYINRFRIHRFRG